MCKRRQNSHFMLTFSYFVQKVFLILLLVREISIANLSKRSQMSTYQRSNLSIWRFSLKSLYISIFYELNSIRMGNLKLASGIQHAIPDPLMHESPNPNYWLPSESLNWIYSFFCATNYYVMVENHCSRLKTIVLDWKPLF